MTAILERQGVRAPTTFPALGIVAVLCLLTPAWFQVAGLLLDPFRLFALFAVPALGIALISGRYGRVNLNDKLILCYAAWYSAAFLINSGADAITHIGLHMLYYLGGYLVGRACVRNVAQLRSFTNFMLGCCVFLLPFGLYEAATGDYVIPAILKSIPGVTTFIDVAHPPRLGIERSQVIFTHPIHLGLFCSFFVGLFLMLNLGVLSAGARVLGALTFVVLCVCAMASGPMTSILLQIGLVTLWAMTRKVSGFWRKFIIVFGAVYIVLELASNNPLIFVLADIVALNSGSANVRKIILDHGMNNVWANPAFGLGLRNWVRPHWLKASVDNHWLLIAMQTGVPALLFVWGICVNLFRTIAKNYRDPENEWDRALFACAVCMTGAFVALAAVAVWQAVASFIFLLLGAFAFLLEGRPEGNEVKPHGGAEAVAPAPGGRYLTGAPDRRRTVL